MGESNTKGGNLIIGLDLGDEHAQVCVIGEEVRRNLFGYGAVIGRQLKVNDVWLEVIGVLKSDPAGGAQGGQHVAAQRVHGVEPSETVLRLRRLLKRERTYESDELYSVPVGSRYHAERAALWEEHDDPTAIQEAVK